MDTRGLEKFAKDYFADEIKSVNNLDYKKIEQIVKEMIKAYNADKQIFLFGNGGSASTASHFACDLGKGTISGCEPWDKGVMRDKKRFRVVCLSDNIPLMTAWGNDTSYADIFVEQLDGLVNKGDVVIGISGSGNSPNVLNAIKLANSKGATTIGLAGYEGGKLKDAAKICLVVPSNSMRRIEDVHLALQHMITGYLYEEIKKQK